MGRGVISKLALGLVFAALGACGGDDGGSAGGGVTVPAPSPAPSPTPTPSPSPTPAFSPVAMQLFEGVPYNTDLRVLGHGTLAGPIGPNEPLQSSRIVEANDLNVTYDATGNVYRADAGIAGKGVLFQVGAEQFDQIPAVVTADAAAAKDTPAEIYVVPGGTDRSYRYVAQVWPWTNSNAGAPDNMFYFGTFGVAQPTRAADVPAAGTVRYTGELEGFFTDDAGAVGLDGELTFDLDLAALNGSGSLQTKFYCMMGCGYPDISYSFAALRRTSANTFEGEIAVGSGGRKGRFSGILAGPGAVEMLLELTFTYPDPTRGRDATFAGIVVARRAAAP